MTLMDEPPTFKAGRCYDTGSAVGDRRYKRSAGLEPGTCRLLPAAFTHAFVGRGVIYIEENAGVGDFHKLCRVTIFADDGVGGLFG